MDFSPTARTTALRKNEKLRFQRDEVYRILDEAHICHVSYQHQGIPRVLPTSYGRIDDVLYIHGSTGSRAFLPATRPLDISIAITVHDGIVLSRSWFHHSANYRCVIAHGQALPVEDDDEKITALRSIVNQLFAGRSDVSRAPTKKELAQTAVLALPLHEASLKARAGGPNEDEADTALPHWAGEVPLAITPDQPIPDPYCREAATPPWRERFRRDSGASSSATAPACDP